MNRARPDQTAHQKRFRAIERLQWQLKAFNGSESLADVGIESVAIGRQAAQRTGAPPLTPKVEHTRQSRPYSGLGLSHFQYKRLSNHLSCSLLDLLDVFEVLREGGLGQAHRIPPRNWKTQANQGHALALA